MKDTDSSNTHLKANTIHLSNSININSHTRDHSKSQILTWLGNNSQAASLPSLKLAACLLNTLLSTTLSMASQWMYQSKICPQIHHTLLLRSKVKDRRVHICTNRHSIINSKMEEVEISTSRIIDEFCHWMWKGVLGFWGQAAGAIVGQFGIDDSLVQYILEDDHGPLITKYLSQNVTELDALRHLHPTMAAVRIATLIKSKAVALKPKYTNAPDPIRRPMPSSAQVKPKGPKGATFE